MNLHKYSEKELKIAAKESFSYRQTLIKLGVKPFGGNYDVLRKAIKYFNVDISHFKGQGWNKGKTFQPKRDINDYLDNKFPINSNRLRVRLIKEGILEHKCSNCSLKEWLGKPIPIELDHINGNNKDNSLSNLRILCPNCHALTPTYRGKNIGQQKA